MLAEDMRLLVQRQKILLLAVVAVVNVSVCASSVSPISQKVKQTVLSDTCTQSGLCYKRGA